MVLVVGSIVGSATAAEKIEFKADFYERSLETDTVRGKGNAWIQSSDRQVWADEIEIDYRVDRAMARGKVRVRDAESDIYCQQLNYSLDGRETILDEAVVVTGQMVLQGSSITRIGKTRYTVEEGSYTNCNLENLPPDKAGACSYQWKLYGRRFTVDVGGYAHIQDALVLIKDMPTLYTPYLIVPVKSERQSGFLLPSLSSHGNKGSGVTVPYYWALGLWHDLELIPTHYSATGYHAQLRHRYAYDRESSGFVNFTSLQRKLGDSPKRESDDRETGKPLGLIGDWGLNTRHRFALSARSHWGLDIRRVSNPIFAADYSADIDSTPDVASLRSQIGYQSSGDSSAFGIGVIDHQSIVATKDSGVDGGGVGQWPLIYYSRPCVSLWSRWLAFEVDSEWSHFYRPGLAYDNVPSALSAGVNSDNDLEFDDNDYVRTGQRLLVEPQIVATVPVPSGFQLQPALGLGLVGYAFSLPSTTSYFRYYSNLNLPLSGYLSKTFRDAAGAKQITHVIQPRVVYSRNLSASQAPSHPFFQRRTPSGTTQLRQPAFDARDLISPHEYLRFEFINRFLRWTGRNASTRFFTLQISEQFNIRNSRNDPNLAEDPRYARELGPVEALSEFSFGAITGQIQLNYQLQTTPGVQGPLHESDWSGGIDYRINSRDYVSLSTRFQNRADEALTDRTARLNFVKTFTSIPDLEGDIEYSIKRGKPVKYAVGATFYRRPTSCWSFTVRAGEDNILTSDHRVFFTTWSFKLDFGSPGTLLRGT